MFYGCCSSAVQYSFLSVPLHIHAYCYHRIVYLYVYQTVRVYKSSTLDMQSCVVMYMGVRSLRERGGRNFIQGDLTSRKIMDYAIRPIGRFNERGGGGGGGCCPRKVNSSGVINK